MLVISNFRIAEGTTVCVIGLGRFGSAVADKLIEKGFSVILVDSNRRHLQNLPDRVVEEFNHIHEVDSTNEMALRSIDVKEAEVAIVAIGGDIQANILTAINLKELGIPRVIAKAQTSLHGRLLERIGVDLVIFPEFDAAYQLVRSLTSSDNMLNSLELSGDCAIVTIKATAKVIGRTVRDLRIRERFQCNVIALSSQTNVQLVVSGEELIDVSHSLIVAGSNEQIDLLETFMLDLE
jgi:trk system potassium uptake protein TrkA